MIGRSHRLSSRLKVNVRQSGQGTANRRGHCGHQTRSTKTHLGGWRLWLTLNWTGWPCWSGFSGLVRSMDLSVQNNLVRIFHILSLDSMRTMNRSITELRVGSTISSDHAPRSVEAFKFLIVPKLHFLFNFFSDSKNEKQNFLKTFFVEI